MNTEQVILSMEARQKNHEMLKTGFKKLDTFLDGGLFKQETIILGAHTGVGKSLIAGQMFYNIAKQGYRSAYFSLEISNEMVVSRIIGSLANIKPTRIRYGLLRPEEYEAKLKAEAELLSLNELTAFYDDLYDYDLIEKQIRENNYEFIVIDFIQNIITKTSDEYARLSGLALRLQKLAKEKDCVILILSQLSNSAAKDGSKTNVVSYKGSGAIATICDLGFILERDREDVTEDSSKVTLTLLKNRRGSSGVKLLLAYQHPGGGLRE